MCVCVCVCARARVRSCTCDLVACVFALFCMKIFVNFTDAADRVETYGAVSVGRCAKIRSAQGFNDVSVACRH